MPWGTPSSQTMANYADEARTPRALNEREQRTLLKVTGEHRAGLRDHVLPSAWVCASMNSSRPRSGMCFAMIGLDGGGDTLLPIAGSARTSVGRGLPKAPTHHLQHGEVKDWGRVGSPAAGGAVGGEMTAAFPGQE